MRYMQHSRYTFLSILLLMFSMSFSLQTAFATERTLTLAVPANIPPFYTDDGKGIIPDIMREALTPYGYKIVNKPMGNIRISKSLQNGEIDIAPYTVTEVQNVYKSQKYLTFLNVAVTKKSKNITIKSLQDLEGLKIAAFQGATEVFGKEYSSVVEAKNMYYRELSDQKSQMSVFWHDRVEVVILAKLIFDYRSFHNSQTRSPADVDYHRIFGNGTPFSAVFPDKKVRDDFDRGYTSLIKSGKIKEIYSLYEY